MQIEIAMYNHGRHRMITHSFTISKADQIQHFQIRLPRNTKRVVAIDYDVVVTSTLDGETTDATNTIDFKWNGKRNPVLGRLKLQSLEKANVFYSEWLKLLEWNINISDKGIFPITPYSLLQKVVPKKVEVPPNTTVLNGFYEDVFIKELNKNFAYEVKVCVWIETIEDCNGVDYEFLNQYSNN